MLTVILFLINRMEGNRPIKDGTTNQNESSEVICFSILKLSPGLLRPAMIGPGLMPTLKVLLRTGLCGYGLGRCGSREHIAWVATWVERFDRRGTEPFELFRSEFGQNSWNRKKTTKNHFIEVACDPKYKKGPEKRETNCLEAARRTTLSHHFTSEFGQNSWNPKKATKSHFIILSKFNTFY